MTTMEWQQFIFCAIGVMFNVMVIVMDERATVMRGMWRW
jgi:hypothetical protein